MKLLNRFLLITFVIGLVACSATGPKFTNIESAIGKSTIYIYRPSKFAAGGTYPTIQVDGIGEYDLKNGGFIRLEVEPGEHKVSIQDRFDWVFMRFWDYQYKMINTKPGSIHFIRFGVDTDWYVNTNALTAPVVPIFDFTLVVESRALGAKNLSDLNQIN